MALHPIICTSDEENYITLFYLMPMRYCVFKKLKTLNLHKNNSWTSSLPRYKSKRNPRQNHYNIKSGDREETVSLLSRKLRGPEQTRLLQLELVQLLLPIHLDDQRDDKNEKGSASDPSRFSSALEELFAHEWGVWGRPLPPVHDRWLRYTWRNPR